MTSVVLHGLSISRNTSKYLSQIITELQDKKINIFLTSDFAKRNKQFLSKTLVFPIIHKIDKRYDMVFSLGGDGTFLEALLWVGNTEVPVLGFNMGRLGFLASIAKEYITESLKLLNENQFDIEKRSLIQLESNVLLFNGKNFALNECAILRKETPSMIMIECNLNGQYLATYWADGLMVSTPTGSTGYSLSCGGPIMMPDTKNFVITPVSPHNLNVRPLIVSDRSELEFRIENGNKDFLVSLDSRSETISTDILLKVKKASFNAKLVRIHKNSFVKTIRNKLGWGLDLRN